MADVPSTAVRLAGLAMTPDGALYVTGISSGITIGTTTITGGATTEVLYNLGGVVQSTSKLIINATAGQGPSVVAGTATTDVAALSVTRTNNNAAVATGVKFAFTDTTSAAGFLPFQILGGAAGTTRLFEVNKSGVIGVGNSTFINTGSYNGELGIGISAGSSYFYMNINNKNVGMPSDYAYAFKNGTGAIDGDSTVDAVITRAAAGVIGAGLTAGGQTTGAFAAAGYRLSTTSFALGTAPTLASGGCTSPTAVTSNGTAAFSVGVGTSCSGSQPLVFTLPAATTGWQCSARNQTNPAGSAPAMSSTVSTTSVTITNYGRTTGLAAAWTDADVVVVSCLGY